MTRREFLILIGTAAAWPMATQAQHSAPPVIGFINGGSAESQNITAFRKGLNEAGYFDGQNVIVEYHWLDGEYDQLPMLVPDLVRRRVAAISTPATPLAALAAKAATATIPIVFSAPADPVHLGLVASLARPGGNVTGINYFSSEVVTKRLRLAA